MKNRKLFLLLILLSPLSVLLADELVWPVKPGEATICRWKDDKVAALSITVDDNCRPDHEWWMKLADELGFKVTWFVITDNVKGNFGGTWEDWQKLADAGHSIQSHTTNHQSAKTMKRELTEEELTAMYRDSLVLINERVKNNRACCIAYPRGEAHREIAKKFAIAARGTSGVPDRADKIDYFNTNAGGNPAAVEVILDGHTEKGPKWIRSKSQLKGGWAVALYHLVHQGRTDEAREEAAKKTEAEIREMASHQDRLWIGRFDEVARYGQERDAAKVTSAVKGDKVVLAVTDQLENTDFDFPLTVKVRLPDGWTKVKGGKFVMHDGSPYALVQIVPDRGEVELKMED